MKNSNRIKGCFMICIPILFSLLLLIIGVVWRTSYAKTEIVTSFSDDGRKKLSVYMIGEPDWPFGPTHCRFELYIDEKRIAKYPFSVRNDGMSCSENNFSILWGEDSVKIGVSGEEQSEKEYVLDFQGKIK